MNPGTQVTPPPDALAKAIWAAGYHAGKKAGENEAAAYEWGSRIPSETPEQAWENFVQWRIEIGGVYALDINNPEHWRDV
jgi:hypothetical protein